MQVNRIWKEARYLLRHGTTLGLANLGAYAVVFTDSVMTAWLGPDEFSGVSLGVLIYTLFLQFALGCSYVIAPQVAESIGKNRSLRTYIIESESLRLGLIFSFAATALIFVGSSFIQFSDSSAGIASNMELYLSIACLAIVPQIICVILGENCVGHGKSQIVLWSVIYAFLCNLLLNYVLAFTFDLGVLGVAASTVVTSFSTLLVVFYLSRDIFKRRAMPEMYLRLRRRIRSRLLSLAFPLGFQEVLVFFLFAQTTAVVGLTHASDLPAHLIVFQVTEAVVLVFFGYGEALATQIAYYAGKADYKGIKRIFIVSVILTGLIGFSSAMLLMLFTDPIWNFYSRNNLEFQGAMKTYEILMVLGSMLVIVQSLQIVVVSALRGLGETQYSTVVSVLCLTLIAFGGGSISARFLSEGTIGIWVFLIIAAAVITVVLFRRLRMLIFNASTAVLVEAE